MRGWLAGKRTLPSETQAYVRIVTGRRAEEWRPQGTLATLNVTVPADMPCGKIAAKLPAPSKEALDKPSFPWGVQLIGDLSEVKALAAYRALQKKHEAILGSYQPRVIRTTTVKMNAARSGHAFVSRQEAARLRKRFALGYARPAKLALCSATEAASESPPDHNVIEAGYI